jgi:hypothetical protein
MAERRQPTPGEIVIMAASGLMLIGSFLPFYKAGDFNWSAWSNAFSLFPLTTLMVLLTVAIGVVVALRLFANVDLPERLWLFTLPQLEFALSMLVAITMLCYVIRDTGAIDKGIGAWLMVLAAIALAVGMVLSRTQPREVGP